MASPCAADAGAPARRGDRLRPHLLGIDDGAFDKHRDRDVPIVAVRTEGADQVEGVALTRFPVDGDGATGFLAGWIGALRLAQGLAGVVLGGVTIAGLGVVDVPALARALARPVLVVNRRDPADHRLAGALRAAGLEARLASVAACPAAFRIEGGPWLACAGIEPARAAALVAASRRKSDLPEALRLAHLFARAVATGESRGRP
ncbi:MAG: DUF99 family protein [Deltaproteobacteria bacterium]|nr:DUF99 family protein [Deltaproteobacteria bacterium]